MAFENEKISEVDRELFNSFNLKSPFTGEALQSRRWVIDREREAYLIALGGQGMYYSEVPMFYAFIWKNNVVKLETFENSKGDILSGYETKWKINRIEAPKSLLQDHEVLMNLIKEAFISEASPSKKDVLSIVHFDYIATPWFVEAAK